MSLLFTLSRGTDSLLLCIRVRHREVYDMSSKTDAVTSCMFYITPEYTSSRDLLASWPFHGMAALPCNYVPE